MLPGITFSGAKGSPPAAAKGTGLPSRRANASDSQAGGAASPVKVLYAGPIEIVSKLPDATNHVQTIRRPDLVAPPKLKFPVRLPTMVMIPPPPAPVVARVPQPAKPADTGVESKLTPEIAKPVLPVPVAVEKPPSTSDQAVKEVATSTQPAPAAGSAPAPAAAPMPMTQENVAKAVVILNGVAVPPDTPVAVPNAEISGDFAVGPSKAISPTGTGTTGPDSTASSSGNGRELAGTGTGKAEGTGEHPGSNAGNGSSPGTPTGTGASGPGNSASAREGNGRLGAGLGNGGSSTGPGSGSTPGISIAGGSGGTRSLPPSRPRPGYGMTIISGGRSGGASRDSGAFGRNEIVYSVYIPMADAGGGPDWPMQYALADPVAAGNGLVAPPIATKKVAAEVSSATDSASGNRIFLSAVITSTGALRDLHPVHAEQSGSQIAMEALQRWEFAPAEVNGRAVDAKVLIGVTMRLSSPLIPPANGIASGKH